MIRTLAIICALILSVGAVLYGSHQLRVQAHQSWSNQATQDVERVTDTSLFWLSLFHAQLRGIGSVFQASAEVTEDELFDALETTEAIEAAIPISTLAYVEPLSQNEYTISISTDLDGALAPGTNVATHQGARQVIDGALALPDHVVMSPAFVYENNLYVLLAFAATNAGIDGVIITPVDLNAFFEGLKALHIPQGISLRLVELNNEEQLRKTVIGAEKPVEETVQTISIKTNGGQAQWEYNWDILPAYQDGPDTGLADVVQLGGLIVVALAFGMIGLLTMQNSRVNQRVTERTQELQKATDKAEQSAQELTNTLEMSEGLRKDADEAKAEADEANRELTVALQEAEAARLEAESANQSKSAFLANMSHEIRTPMNAILGFTEILHSLIQDKQQQQYLGSIQTSGKSLLTLINDILDLSKVEAGKLDIEYGPVHLPILTQDMDMIFSPKVFEKNLNFVVDVDENLPETVMLDETRLRQVLVNLIGNGIKFTQEGQVALTVRAIYRDNVKHPALAFAVSDTGIGIPQDQQDKIFGAFEQRAGQSINEFGGTGLGLAISKRLATLMNGEILLESEEGKGSTFTLLLHDVEVVDSVSDHVSVSDSKLAAVNFEPATILIADDVRIDRQLVQGHLAPYAFQVIEAENGSEVLEVVKDKRPDLLLMDIKMPVLDGFKAAQLIKGQDVIKDIPIIAITASAMRETVEEISQFFDGYLPKPFSKNQLIRELARFLKHTVDAQAALKAEAQETNNTMDAGSLARLPDLIQILEDEQESVTQLVATLTINDIETFADRMQSLGTDFGCPPLQSWAETLAEQTTMFDMDALPQTLNTFSDLIADMHTHIQS